MDRHTTAEGVGIAAPVALQVAASGPRDYAILAGRGSNSLSTFEITPGGLLIPHDHLLDTPETRRGAPRLLETAVQGSFTYVTAGGCIEMVKAFRAYALDANVERLYLQTLRNAEGEGMAGINGIGNGLET